MGCDLKQKREIFTGGDELDDGGGPKNDFGLARE